MFLGKNFLKWIRSKLFPHLILSHVLYQNNTNSLRDIKVVESEKAKYHCIIIKNNKCKKYFANSLIMLQVIL